MAGQLMLVNPKARKRKTTTRKRKSPPKRRTATRRRSTATRRRSTAKSNGRTARASAVAHANPRRRRRRSRGGGGGKLTLNKFMNTAVVPAAIGGTGALALDAAMGYVPLPARFKSGLLGRLTKLGGAVALGLIGRRVASKRIGDQIMVGAVTVGLYQFGRSAIEQHLPDVNLAGDTMEYVNAGQFLPDPLIGPRGHIPDYETRQSAGLSEYVSGTDYHGGMGEYISGY